MANDFDPIKKEVLDILAKYKAFGQPKTFPAVFGFLFSATSDMVELVEKSSALVTGGKKETVVAAVKFLYTELNPDLPWIPEPFEMSVENWLLDSAVPVFIDWIVSKYNEKGIFKK